MSMEEVRELNEHLAYMVELIDDVLERYINDEVGEAQRDKFESMTKLDKISLLTFTLKTCPCWDDFETEIVINFDYGNY